MEASPYFPKRAVVTAGMPYGDKEMHLGHIGACFILSDIYARFLRDRIGPDNVIYVSGTDCYGAGPVVKHQNAVEEGYSGDIEDFVSEKYALHKEVLAAYNISLNFYGASGLGEAKEIHHALSQELFEQWFEGGYLRVEEVEQFYDEENDLILNGRQVEGSCPHRKCKSNSAWADECELGHQYSPRELVNPKIVSTGKVPSFKAVKNWYFDLERYGDALKERQKLLEAEGISRKFLLANVADFLKDPAILIRTEDFASLRQAMAKMPSHVADINEEAKSASLTFKVLKDREEACALLREQGIRFRTGTTLVPFRLTGNVAWGIPSPEKAGVADQTFWVWPESLWAPMSFSQTYLKANTGSTEGWEDWWFASDSRVYQFIGEDNIFFYAVAEMGLFMALNEMAGRPQLDNLPRIVPSRHIFFGKSKAASSGALRAPTAAELLEHYTPEQLRMHFAHMALHSNNVSLKPKAITGEEGFDATLAEGNILTNVYNRLVRSCFYSVQKYFDGRLPQLEVSKETKQAADTMISEYEWAMYRFELAKVIDLLDVYLRDANKTWSAQTKLADAENVEGIRAQTLVDAFHVVRVAVLLLHPFAPEGSEKVREYLGVDERLWDWAHVNESLSFFIEERAKSGSAHAFKFLEPRVDFFYKHPSQLK